MKSMTAYSNVVQRKKSQTIQLTIRSLNFKYLDVSIHNLPAESIFLEEKIKKEIKKRIGRGKIEVYVFMKHPAGSQVHIDERVLGKYVSQVKKAGRKFGLNSQLSITDVLSLPGVVWVEEKKTQEEGLILSALRQGLNNLERFKKREGRVIKNEMLKNLCRLKANINYVKKHKPKKSRSADNNKEDIDEEISLMAFYAHKLEQKIHSPKNEPKGKSVDFLTQEILRELNSASSKTKRKMLSSLIVESKTYLERIREQAQNIE